MSFFSRLFHIFSVKNPADEAPKMLEAQRRDAPAALPQISMPETNIQITPESVNGYFSAAAKRAEDEITYYMLSSLNCVSVKTVRKPSGSETVFTFETDNPQENIEMLQEQLAMGLSLKYGATLNPRVVLIGKIPVPPKPMKSTAEMYDIKPVAPKPARYTQQQPQPAPPSANLVKPSMANIRSKLAYEDDFSELRSDPLNSLSDNQILSQLHKKKADFSEPRMQNRVQPQAAVPLLRENVASAPEKAPAPTIAEKPAPVAPDHVTPQSSPKIYPKTSPQVQSSEPTMSPAQEATKAARSENFPKNKIAGFKAVVAVASGKGGVGKSSVALGLARALVKRGVRTALLDADLYGPSVENMSGEHERVRLNSDKSIPSVERHGIEIASVGFTTEPGSAVVLRGPMVSGVIKQLIEKTSWKNNPEILVIDTPPGTGDAHLTLFRDMEINGVYMVSTAHKAAVSDTKRSVSFIKRLDTPIFGIVDNMNGFACDECGKEHFVFKNQSVRNLAHEENIDYLGALPISEAAMDASQNGMPVCDCGDAEFEIFFDGLVTDCLRKTGYQPKALQAPAKADTFEAA